MEEGSKRIDDGNRRISLFTNDEEGITLWYDKFERRLYVEDTKSQIKYLSDGQTYIPSKIESTEILYSVAVNGVLSIKFSKKVDRRTLNTITVNDVQYSGSSSGKIVNFLEDDTLVLMKYENAYTMIVQGTVIDQLKNEISFSNLVAWPVIYRLFPSEESLRDFWKVNQKKLTSIATEDVTDKDFNFDYSNDTDSSYKWLNEDWKTFYYDPTTNISYESSDSGSGGLSNEHNEAWALCYLREIPVGFEGEKEGPYWYATNFMYNDKSSRIEMMGWIGDINSHFNVEKLYDSYSSVETTFSNVEESMKYYEQNSGSKNLFESFIYSKNDNWFLGSKGKQIQDAIVLLITPEGNVLAFTFKEYQLSEITKIAGAAKLGTSVTFEKKNYGTEQDKVSEYVILARNNDGGLYNATKETFYDDRENSSPSGTEWNSQYSSVGASKNSYGWNDLSNVESRVYSTFHQALNRAIGNNILDTELVMRDKMTGQYWKFDFHSWTQGGNGGGFSYTRTLIK